MKAIIFALSLSALCLSGCVTPRYQNVVSSNETQQKLNPNDINYKVSDLYYRTAPDCVVVMKTQTKTPSPWDKEISVALARHLGTKIDKVIFPRKRLQIEKKNAYDFSLLKERIRFSQHIKCRYYARAQLYDLANEYAVVFSKKHIGIKIDLARFKDDKILWQAAHTIWRAEGGMPLSPLGALGGITSAMMFNNNPEIMPSLIDDALRRLMRTLPST